MQPPGEARRQGRQNRPLRLVRLRKIRRLTTDLGVNLAGVEVILRLQRMMEEADVEFDRVMDYIRQNVLDKRHGIERENALVKAVPRGLAKR